jgi:hypothetical protein
MFLIQHVSSLPTIKTSVNARINPFMLETGSKTTFILNFFYIPPHFGPNASNSLRVVPGFRPGNVRFLMQ